MVTAIITGIITSLIASIIFYMVFNLIPERRKTNAIRPRIEIELVEISESLFFFIEVAFRHSEYTASMFQTNLRERTITEDDFRIGLQNKCLSKGYLYDSNSDGMLIVGHMLEKLSSEVCRKIDRVLSNQVFLSSEEILIVEQVERKRSITECLSIQDPT